jgi:hypothetical protein
MKRLATLHRQYDKKNYTQTRLICPLCTTHSTRASQTSEQRNVEALPHTQSARLARVMAWQHRISRSARMKE